MMSQDQSLASTLLLGSEHKLVLDRERVCINAFARLRHTWLENQILNKNGDDVVFLWRLGAWQALEQQFVNRVRETLELASTIEGCFSPIQLLEELSPFRDLSPDTLMLLRDGVHRSYLKSFPASLAAEMITNSTRKLEVAIDKLRKQWQTSDSTNGEAALLSAWNETWGCAQELLSILRSLPRGVVLP